MISSREIKIRILESHETGHIV